MLVWSRHFCCHPICRRCVRCNTTSNDGYEGRPEYVNDPDHRGKLYFVCAECAQWLASKAVPRLLTEFVDGKASPPAP